MRMDQERRAAVLAALLEGRCTVPEAAATLQLSTRQVQRLRAAYLVRGASALVHGNRGRVSSRAVPADIRARVIELATTKYAGFNQRHLTNVLAEAEGVHLSRSTVRRILISAGLVRPRPRRPRRLRPLV